MIENKLLNSITPKLFLHFAHIVIKKNLRTCWWSRFLVFTVRWIKSHISPFIKLEIKFQKSRPCHGTQGAIRGFGALFKNTSVFSTVTCWLVPAIFRSRAQFPNHQATTATNLLFTHLFMWLRVDNHWPVTRDWNQTLDCGPASYHHHLPILISNLYCTLFHSNKTDWHLYSKPVSLQWSHFLPG